ncbi:hypothetical protein PILCRDRAFT_810329 [Piloderma croceum F 1598]|uniref:Uncharacterized protein n=1 Tax=Piloderma croceum (strain F 1598) TaxID=765440 RepID=A0A0C3C0B4_PILCF|nr:hypothetical protein PILCRDRAFT_810329 [Piloderma croceum F 1598]
MELECSVYNSRYRFSRLLGQVLEKGVAVLRKFDDQRQDTHRDMNIPWLRVITVFVHTEQRYS